MLKYDSIHKKELSERLNISVFMLYPVLIRRNNR